MKTSKSPLTPRKLFLTFALSEALTWTFLLGGLAFRQLFGAPQLLLTIIGGIHGAVFLGYAVSAAIVGVNQRWSLFRIVGGVALAIVPYATIPFERSVDGKGMLNGAWRLEATEDRRDHNWFDRLFRWFLNRPVLLVLTMLAVISAIFATLLIVGPPGGWPKAD